MAAQQAAVVDIGALAARFAESMRVGTDAGLRAGGAVLPPTVLLLAEDLDQPVVGKLTVRPFHPGADAAAAIAGLGLLPSVLAATRLVVTYERQDVNAALGEPVDPDACALVAINADFDEHATVEYPLRVTPAADWRRIGAVMPEWGEARRAGDALPRPVEQLLDLWRQLHRADVEETLAYLDAAGYRMQWWEQQ